MGCWDFWSNPKIKYTTLFENKSNEKDVCIFNNFSSEIEVTLANL